MPDRSPDDCNRPGRNDSGQAKRHRLEKARAYLRREQRLAQCHLQGLEQALIYVWLPETLVVEVECLLQTLGKLLGKIFGVLFPTRFGCQTSYELTRVRGWDKNLPSKLLGALPKRK